MRRERKLTKLEAIVTDKSYYFNLPFESDTVFDRKDQSYKSDKYGFKAEIKVGSLVDGELKNVFDIGETEAFTFRGRCLIGIDFPMKVKVNKIVFKQTGNAVKHLSFFNDGNLEETIRLIEDDLYETKNGGKYTSIDVHKSQQEREFIVHLSFAEGSDSILEGGGFIFRAKIKNQKRKKKIFLSS
ncbi:hypothetical protein LOTGIDRAFT_172410 [Lottia gigantea]|uniref:Uncharacterized protein n=1 Tax=Lottia gigantea TaxID=225164 RepID=V4AWA7_LOTGI|nr:hypothetical protein LOTGIDRAFT_172410 [Lottia gigantea]ESP01763.1 hypothetical protein LOTGIDRAFT_172410 [Lottia gigantea]